MYFYNTVLLHYIVHSEFYIFPHKKTNIRILRYDVKTVYDVDKFQDKVSWAFPGSICFLLERNTLRNKWPDLHFEGSSAL